MRVQLFILIKVPVSSSRDQKQIINQSSTRDHQILVQHHHRAQATNAEKVRLVIMYRFSLLETSSPIRSRYMNNALCSPGLGNLWQFLRAWTNPKTDDMPGLGYLICFQTIFECKYLRGKICSISLVHGFGCFCSALLSILWADSILEQALHHIYILLHIYYIVYIILYTITHLF